MFFGILYLVTGSGCARHTAESVMVDLFPECMVLPSQGTACWRMPAFVRCFRKPSSSRHSVSHVCSGRMELVAELSVVSAIFDQGQLFSGHRFRIRPGLRGPLPPEHANRVNTSIVCKWHGNSWIMAGLKTSAGWHAENQRSIGTRDFHGCSQSISGGPCADESQCCCQAAV